jgi:histidinol-phosphatase (PHP family)
VRTDDSGATGDQPRAVLPTDSHVHSQWSWDAPFGAMEETCRRAVELGLPAIAFTEHADFTPWVLDPAEEVPEHWRDLVTGGVLTPPPPDLAGYRDSLDRCRRKFPDLRILSGVELGEPHWHPSSAGAVLAGGFDRVLASVHCAPAEGGHADIFMHLRDQDPGPVMRGFLAECAALITAFADFDVLAHIDYPVRFWPPSARPYDPLDYQDETRHVLRALAAASKALEINTRVPLHPVVLSWWREEGGQAITFASDAHLPGALAAGFAAAARLAATAGFEAAPDPAGLWRRAG